jgi:hypothetical protein
MNNNTQTRSDRFDTFTYVVYRTMLNPIGQELKSIMFVTDDETFANDECGRFSEQLSIREQRQGVAFKAEKVPVISRRKSRHPYLRRNSGFDIADFEKNGNVAEPPKMRGRIKRDKNFA